ncbi:MAG: aspartate--tRNA ligase [Candidatus Tectomicrobia bacterium]|nr:aspartate--tRNA ligase [Candidatus Tectomicrobia bacterium]
MVEAGLLDAAEASAYSEARTWAASCLLAPSSRHALVGAFTPRCDVVPALTLRPLAEKGTQTVNPEPQPLSRTHTCGELRPTQIGEEAVLMGWVQRSRNLGGVTFIDLRDRWGITQVVVDQKRAPEAHELADRLRGEYVIAVRGTVEKRPAGTENPALPTGSIDVLGSELHILNESKTPPFAVEDDAVITETLRLRYRYLDLRRPHLQANLMLRHRATMAVRRYLDQHGFIEIETPMLTRSTPEGARDFLVPSRLSPGKFYALPQSPQLFKQLLMVAGYERYFQIARCFRDEDLRADRQPEFTQIDIETSFLTREAFFALLEGMIQALFRDAAGRDVRPPFQRLSYADAMDRYGVDNPDTRFGVELRDLSDVAALTEVKVFKEQLAAGGIVKGIAVPGCAGYSRKELDDLGRLAADFGGKGLFWMKRTAEGLQAPFGKHAGEGQLAAMAERLAMVEGDLALIAADAPAIVAPVLGNARKIMAQRLNLASSEALNFLWITEFPLLEYDAEARRYVAVHHPFTAPVEADVPLFHSEPNKIRAQAYDLVLNGQEIGGGSRRIHRREVQNLMFSALGLSQEEAQEKFGFLLEALEFGTPPHGGIAFGLDRLIAIMARMPSIREVIAFPKTQRGADLMMNAPSAVEPAQLRELNLQVR